jgi:hypothetical protein
MKPSGKEFEGKLSLARAKLMEIAIERYRKARDIGIKVQLESCQRRDVRWRKPSQAKPTA